MNNISTSISLSANGERSRTIRLWTIVFIFSLCLFSPHLTAEQELPFPKPEATISMDFQDARLKDILKIFSIQSSLSFIASEALQDRTVTLYLDNVPIKEAMDKIFKANNLSYELEPSSNIFIVKDWGRPQIETVTKVFYLKYATVSSSSLKEEMASQLKATTTTGAGGGEGGGEGKWATEEDVGITKAVKKILSEYGSAIEDFRTNSLIVTDIPSRLPVIEKVIASLDVRVPQVLLEVEMLDVSKNVVDKMGIKFGQTPIKLALTGATATMGFPFHSWGKLFTADRYGSLQINSGTSTDASYNPYTVLLDFLKTQTDTKYLARPRILTLNNETAEIRIATNESVGLKTTTTSAEGTGTTTAEAERTETGVVLRVTPQVNVETGEITMFVYPKVSEAVAGNTLTSGGSAYTYRDPEERSTKSVVRVKDGETVIIGGLIRNEFTGIESKVPILGDLPIIGFLFRHKGGGSSDSPKNKQRELLIFITPHIIKDDIELAQAKKVTALPEREQNAVSGVNRQAVISSSLNNFEKKKK